MAAAAVAELIDDAVAEVLLRVPPDEPAHLLRAALVCKPWRRIISAPAFLRRYREFHGTPPLLGFISLVDQDRVPRFFPTTAASPYPQPACGRAGLSAHDCRHGRVLLYTGDRSEGLLVWDPVAGDRRRLGMPTSHFLGFSAAVLCAVPGCNHLSCHSGPFLVVFVWEPVEHDALRSSVYSSETGAWSAVTSAGNGDHRYVLPDRGTLVGNRIYFMLSKCSILKYDLGNHSLSVIDWPGKPEVGDVRVVLMPMEDGSLWLAGIWVSSLQLWSMNMDPKGVATWVQIRVIDLETTPVLPSGNPYRRADVIAFAEGVGIIFVTTNVAIFTIELKSGRIRKVCDLSSYSIVPFMSFYTPDCARSRLPLSAEIN